MPLTVTAGAVKLPMLNWISGRSMPSIPAMSAFAGSTASRTGATASLRSPSSPAAAAASAPPEISRLRRERASAPDRGPSWRGEIPGAVAISCGGAACFPGPDFCSAWLILPA
jgi:hypothetical protein